MAFQIKRNKSWLSWFLLILEVHLLITTTNAWLLAQLGLNETYRVRHLSTHYARVFLSISVKSNNFPTLIESRWPVRYSPLRASIFPSLPAHDLGRGDQRDCRRIQKAIWSQVDNLNRLWVMDIGWQQTSMGENGEEKPVKQICEPKLLVYDLLRYNVEVMRIDCGRYISGDPSKLLAIKLGPPPLIRCQEVESYIYFLRADDSHILAYDIVQQKWQQRLLVSRKYEHVIQEMLPIKPIDLAFTRQRELIISDVDGGLYSTTNSLLLHSPINGSAETQVDNAVDKSWELLNLDSNGQDKDLFGYLKMEYLGSLLGPSRGMMIDYLNVLFYVVPKFGAVVRCPHYRQNLTAEGNEIIYMTSKNIQQIFFGSQDSVWLVTDRELQPNDHCFAGLT